MAGKRKAEDEEDDYDEEDPPTEPPSKKPKPAPSGGVEDEKDEEEDDEDEDDEFGVIDPKQQSVKKKSGAGGNKSARGGPNEDDKDNKDDDEDDEDDKKEIADGTDFEKRRKGQGQTDANGNDDDEHDDEGNDEARMADREKMAEMLRYFTPEQMDRYECYRRSSLPKPVLRRVFQAVTGTILNPNGLIVLAAVGKLFVGELVELARQIADDEGVDDLTEIKPAHVREAHRRMENGGLLFRPRKKTLFRKRGA